MADVVHINHSKWQELEQILTRLSQLDPVLGLERDEHGVSLNKTAITNDFASRRLEQIIASHPTEWAEYCELAVREIDLMRELGITDTIMNELFPEERDIDARAILQGNMLQVIK